MAAATLGTLAISFDSDGVATGITSSENSAFSSWLLTTVSEDGADFGDNTRTGWFLDSSTAAVEAAESGGESGNEGSGDGVGLTVSMARLLSVLLLAAALLRFTGVVALLGVDGSEEVFLVAGDCRLLVDLRGVACGVETAFSSISSSQNFFFFLSRFPVTG